MKIVHQGDPDKPKWWLHADHTCRTCGTVIRLEAGDPVDRYDDQRNGELVAFTCPTCGQRVVTDRPRSA